MIKVLDKIKTESGFILLICDKFTDDVITNKLSSNLAEYKLFSVDPLRGCFSEPKSRTIILKDKDIKDYKSIEYVNFE